MNKIEEVYVFCNRVRWHTAYIPQPENQVTLHCCYLLLLFLLPLPLYYLTFVNGILINCHNIRRKALSIMYLYYTTGNRSCLSYIRDPSPIS